MANKKRKKNQNTETVHKARDNAYKLIFEEPEMFLDFLKNFIPI